MADIQWEKFILWTLLLFITFSVQKSMLCPLYTLLKHKKIDFVYFIFIYSFISCRFIINFHTSVAKIMVRAWHAYWPLWSFPLSLKHCISMEYVVMSWKTGRKCSGEKWETEFSAGRIKIHSGLCDYENGDDENEGMTWKLNVKPKSWLLPKSKLTKLPRYSSSSLE